MRASSRGALGYASLRGFIQEMCLVAQCDLPLRIHLSHLVWIRREQCGARSVARAGRSLEREGQLPCYVCDACGIAGSGVEAEPV